MSLVRSRWAAIGAAVAVTLGAGGIGLVSATNPSGASTLVTITPCRLIDTRPGGDNVGPRETALGAGDTFTIKAHGSNGDCVGIPTTATGLSLNVTAIGATQPSFFTIWPTGAQQPNSSSMNPVPGEPPTPNAVTTQLSPVGQFDIFNLAGSVDVIVDVNGYYVDHDHDDRYYTKVESDARFVPAPADPMTISISPYEMRLTSANTGWSIDLVSGFVGYNGLSGFDCISVPVDPPIGAKFDNVHLSYSSSSTVSAQAAVTEVQRELVTGTATSKSFTTNPSLPAPANGTVGSATLPFTDPILTARSGYEYALFVCSEDNVGVTGVELNLA